MISSVPSLEPPSLMMCSIETDWELIELRQEEIVEDEFNVAVIIEIEILLIILERQIVLPTPYFFYFKIDHKLIISP